ncbi:hypothetical protein LZ32DRAFT_621216 [Colletotrichum eremochloae]|nr:hypothetical protein LZ32DRAFT_621216 [Colletotrichum eremochloae]
MQPVLLLSLATATLVTSATIGTRAAAECKMFQIFKSPDTVAGGSPGFVNGASACCCIAKECNIYDNPDGIMATATLSNSLAGDWTITNNSGGGALNSMDDGINTWTVGSGGPSKQAAPQSGGPKSAATRTLARAIIKEEIMLAFMIVVWSLVSVE